MNKPTIDIHVSEHGNNNARTAVLLHSSGLSGAQWRAYLEPLALAGWHTIALDFIGNGRSAPWQSSRPFDLRHDVAEVVSVLRSLAGRTCAVVGHSYGGFVGLQALLDPSVQTVGAVLFEPGAWGILASNGSQEERTAFRATSLDWFSDDTNAGSEIWMQQFVEYWGGQGAWEFLGSRGREAMMASARQTYAQARSLSFDETPLEAYESLSVPVHLITGAQSPPEVGTICRLLADIGAGNTLTEVPGGHMTPVVDPITVVPIICSALGDLLSQNGGR